MFFRDLDTAHPALTAGPAALGPSVIEDLYKKMDALVGRVAAELGPKGALFVMSDHGFKSFRRGVNLNAWLRANGYLALAPGRTASAEWFKDVDWTKTRAYGLGLGGIYLNLAGRESRGTVKPGAEAAALKAELSRKLLALRDGANGPAAITHIYDREAVYAGPYKENAPDLIIGYNEGYRASWDGVTGVVDGTVIEDNVKCWSGDHCIDTALVPGVLFSSLKIKRSDPSIMDVAPTVLELFGLTPPPHMDGRGLVDVAALARDERRGGS
jgi:predicted AlkP superfamily phosphohydrolase/phosphomutase